MITRGPDGTAAEIERRVSLRMARQAVLIRPTPAHLWLVLDEAGLAVMERLCVEALPTPGSLEMLRGMLRDF
jgi:hypothetical protein